jgi:dihydropteroate synthase
LAVAAAAGAGVVATHIRSAERGAGTELDDSAVTEEVCASLAAQAGRALCAGIPKEHVILDVGLDMDKTPSTSLKLLLASGRLAALGYPLLLAASNQAFLRDCLDLGAAERADATSAANSIGLSLGCRLLRAHDVARACRVRDMIGAILEAR